MRKATFAACLLAAGSIVSIVSASYAVEAYTILANGQKIQGDVLAGSDVRLRFPMPAGAEPRITLTLVGGLPQQPIRFQARLFGPDDKEIAIPGGALKESHRTGRDSLTFRGLTSTQTGYHEFVVSTGARVKTRASGKLTIARATKIPFAGDETSAALKVELQPGDTSYVSVRRVDGTAPTVATYKPANGVQVPLQPKKTSKGATSFPLQALNFGSYEYTIGYQDVPAAGRWKGTIRVGPFKGGFPATLVLRNSPGVPLTMFPSDRTTTPTFGTGHVGVASDGNVLLVTAEQGGTIFGMLHDADLGLIGFQPTPKPLATSADISPGQTISGHRLMFMGSLYYLAFSTASGQELAIRSIVTDASLNSNGYAQLLTGSSDPTADFFLAGDGAKVSVGVFRPADGHTVTLLDAGNFGVRSTVTIGGPAFPQAQGSGAAWRAADFVYEFWTPDTLDYHGPSHLHRAYFSSDWTQSAAATRPAFDAFAVETMPTAVTVDAVSKATILHYIVADNPPSAGAAPGSGKIHRRLFDDTGTEIPNSHTVLPFASCNRPAAAILGKFLYLAFETPTGVQVERFPMLR